MNNEEKELLKADLSKIYGKVFVTTEITMVDDALGDNEEHTLTFDVWDGFAYCYDYEGHEYCLYFPQRKLISMSTDMQNNIRNYVGLSKETIIDPIHILQTYNHRLVKVK